MSGLPRVEGRSLWKSATRVEREGRLLFSGFGHPRNQPLSCWRMWFEETIDSLVRGSPKDSEETRRTCPLLLLRCYFWVQTHPVVQRLDMGTHQAHLGSRPPGHGRDAIRSSFFLSRTRGVSQDSGPILATVSQNGRLRHQRGK